MNKVIVIAEAGVNHNGDLDNAIKLIDVAAKAGADFVKFQTFKAKNLVTKQAQKAIYQQENTSGSSSQFDMLSQLEIPADWYPKLIQRCKEKEIGFLSTGFDLESIDFLDQGFTPMECSSEEEARSAIEKCIEEEKWPCYFSPSNTTGEKSFEEFYREDEQLDLERFENLGIVKSELNAAGEQLDLFLEKVNEMREKNHWGKEEIVTLFQSLLPEFNHIETLRSLDQKM